MRRGGGPTRLGIIILVVIIVAAVIGGIVWVSRNFFSGENQKSAEENISAGQKLLNKPTAGTGVRMSVRGPITAQEDHYSIALTISQTSRGLTIWRGYDGTKMTEENLANSAASFTDFALALNRAKFMTKVENVENPDGGICAVGQLIQFEIFEYVKNNSGETTEKSAEKLWTTSCNDITGNFGGLAPNTINLFLDQIPDARNRISAAKNDIYAENRAEIGSPWEGLGAFK